MHLPADDHQTSSALRQMFRGIFLPNFPASNDTEVEGEEVDCTGDAWRYQTADGDWRTEVTYPDKEMMSSSVSFDGFFNATGGEVTVSSIPASIAPAVSDTLYGRTIQLNLTCNHQADTSSLRLSVDEQDSCVLFQVEFSNYRYDYSSIL